MSAHDVKSAIARPDFAAIAQWVAPGTKVLDLGCGDGSLLRYLQQTRNTRGYGVEIADANIAACVKNGVNVIQMDLETGLSIFESDSFDYVILSQTLQAMKNTEIVVREMLRVGREGIVTFPNFGYWRHRLQVVSGHMPVSTRLPYQWYDTPNIHLCTLKDFEEFCDSHSVRILERAVMSNGSVVSVMPNLMGSLAVYRFEQAKPA
jgi:methionine biosynthesis protein MetW